MSNTTILESSVKSCLIGLESQSCFGCIRMGASLKHFVPNKFATSCNMKKPSSLVNGYGRLFDPFIPSRIMDPLSDHIHRGCLDEDIPRIEAAIDILSKQHQKRVHEKYVSYREGECDHHTWCKPTPFADALIKELQGIITQIRSKTELALIFD